MGLAKREIGRKNAKIGLHALEKSRFIQNFFIALCSKPFFYAETPKKGPNILKKNKTVALDKRNPKIKINLHVNKW